MNASPLRKTWQTRALENPDGEAIVHWVAGDEPVRWRWRDLLTRAAQYAHALKQAGCRSGDVCAVIVRHHVEFYPLYMGISALGAIPSVLAYPNPRLHPDKFRAGLAGMASRSGLKWILTEQPLEALIRPLIELPGSTVQSILLPFEMPLSDPECEPALFDGGDAEAPCLLQHSSGTTGLQKGVMLSHRCVTTHVTNYARALNLKDISNTRIVSWLPLYHDMGLITAFHLPLALGIPVVHIDPFEWVQAPVLWIEAMSRERGTHSWLPNFAYSFMADRIHDDDLAGLNLNALKQLINCSEPVRHDSHERFLRRFEKLGVKSEHLSACYAMAETTFAVTQTPPGFPARVLHANRERLAAGEYSADSSASARTCVSSGKLLPGCSIQVIDSNGKPLPDKYIGLVSIRSQSMFDGYRNNPEQTASVLKPIDSSSSSERWYESGDLGFCADGEYFIVGRKKDVIIVAGKNIYPEDIEDALASVECIVPGRVVAFGVDDDATGTEHVCVVVEAQRYDVSGSLQLRMAIVEAGMKIDVTISRVYLAPSRWLVKSSAGKLSRSANRMRALAELTPL